MRTSHLADAMLDINVQFSSVFKFMDKIVIFTLPLFLYDLVFGWGNIAFSVRSCTFHTIIIWRSPFSHWYFFFDRLCYVFIEGNFPTLSENEFCVLQVLPLPYLCWKPDTVPINDSFPFFHPGNNGLYRASSVTSVVSPLRLLLNFLITLLQWL